MKFWLGMTVKPILVGNDKILLGDSEDLVEPLKYSTITALITALNGGVTINVVGSIPVTNMLDLNRIDLPNGQYNIEGADIGMTGVMFVGNYKIATVLDSIIQIYFSGGNQILYRIIPIAEPLVYPAWVNLGISAAERATLEANTTFLNTLKSTRITTSGGDISLDFAYSVFRTVHSGTAAVALTTFSNIPTYSCDREVYILNAEAVAQVFTPRTASLTVGAVTYTFVNMGTATITIPAGKSAELSYKIIKISETSYEIRLAFAIQP